MSMRYLEVIAVWIDWIPLLGEILLLLLVPVFMWWVFRYSK